MVITKDDFYRTDTKLQYRVSRWKTRRKELTSGQKREIKSKATKWRVTGKHENKQEIKFETNAMGYSFKWSLDSQNQKTKGKPKFTEDH